MNKCEICECDQCECTMKSLKQEILEWRKSISETMPPDFKDWWENSKREWPQIAAVVISERLAYTEELENNVDKYYNALEKITNCSEYEDPIKYAREAINPEEE